MEYNRAPVSIRDGHVYIDGIEAADSVKCEIKFTPDVWQGKLLGDKSDSSRWLGYKITGSITRRRSTPWLKEIIKKYRETGETPEFTIQGIQDDKGSEYYKNYGTDTITAVGCVLTGDLPLTTLDSGGDILDDVIGFNAYDVV